MPNNIAKYTAEKICEAFPTEVIKTYYISPVKKKDSADNKSKASKGKLVSMWRNKRSRNKKFSGTVSKLMEEIASDISDGSMHYIIIYLILNIIFKFNYCKTFYFFIEKVDEKILESLKWLEANEAPWTEVLLHWSATYDLRKKDLYNNTDKNLSNIFSKWVHYKHPHGYNLITQDFSKMSLSNVTLTELNFKHFFNVILQNFSINPKDDDGYEMLDKLKKEDLNNGFNFFSLVISLSLLKNINI